MGSLVVDSGGDRRVLAPSSDGYPAKLLRLSSPPRALHLDGAWNHSGPIVAIVGARDATDDGIDFAASLAADLVQANAAIVSGLAVGIDAAAHRGALRAGGRSGAVLGTGLNRCYPQQHASLQEELRRSLGLMSELEADVPGRRGTFAARNRIVAALADVVVVVQGKSESGSLLTAEEATRIGVPVAAVPWDPRERLSEAPNALLRSGVGKLVRDAADVLALAGAQPPSSRAPSALSRPRATVDPARLSELESRAFAALRSRAQSLDQVAERAGIPASAAGAALSTLELVGLARREPGGLFRRSGGG